MIKSHDGEVIFLVPEMENRSYDGRIEFDLAYETPVVFGRGGGRGGIVQGIEGAFLGEIREGGEELLAFREVLGTWWGETLLLRRLVAVISFWKKQGKGVVFGGCVQ